MKRKQKKKLESQILKLVRNSSSKLSLKKIGEKLNLITKKDQKILKKKLRNLKERGKLINNQNAYASIEDSKKKVRIGYLEIVRSGTGFFLTPEGEQDIKIPRKNLVNALNNDLVAVQVIKLQRT